MSDPVTAPAETQAPSVPVSPENTPPSQATPPPPPSDAQAPTEGAPAAPSPGPPKDDKPDAAPQVFEISGEQVSLDELKEAYSHIQKSIEVRKAVADREAKLNTAVEHLKNDPRRVLLDIFTAKSGNNRDKGWSALIDFCSGVINEHIKYDSLPDEAREGLRYKEEADAARAELKRLQDALAAESREAAIAENFAYWNPKITAAATAAGLGTDEDTVADISELMVQAQEAGFQLSPERAAQKVREIYLSRVKTNFGAIKSLSDVPPEIIEQIRKLDLETVTSTRSPATTAPGTPAPSTEDRVILPSRRSTF